MAKGRKVYRNGRNKGLFLALPHSVIDSSAFRELSSAAKVVTLAIARLFNGRNNGALAFAERAGCDWGLSQNTTRRALREAEAAGLIHKTKAASFTSKRLATEWAISWQPLPAGMKIVVASAISPSGKNAPRSGQTGRYARRTPDFPAPVAAISTAATLPGRAA